MSDLPSAIHPDILPRLDPKYVAFHNTHLVHRVLPCTILWHPDIRKALDIPGDSPVMTVGAVKDINNNCISVALDYRLAPENPYPAAVEDTVDALKFIYYNGKAEFNANVNKIAVGGSSSGGNLAAITCLKAQELTPPIPIIFQLLIVLVTEYLVHEDNKTESFLKMFLLKRLTS
ncbi:alpha/beta hydrolase fold-domain-containing protein [Suillus fuscotomentosus]|uniref:Alpha/beta hydrolase fold-domain-containing protein n=1 Tax=Suillus fuscotomentosus TaxID=1912939 RepID=A0AAD4HIR5_9AGAM|nr:alpha/beta hydrolase fold-domain-containing protein [Suillus fuscotomentosus]KAG1898108.1 alpha/beta hydrolase fold-domain-containing protein [Suillus fuscotomentosus]